jgi:hypothetical protein
MVAASGGVPTQARHKAKAMTPMPKAPIANAFARAARDVQIPPSAIAPSATA